MAPIYRTLPPQTRQFLCTTMEVALASASEAVLQLLAAADVSAVKTKAALHLAIVRAMVPVFLDPAFPQSEIRELPVEWPPFIDDPGTGLHHR